MLKASKCPALVLYRQSPIFLSLTRNFLLVFYANMATFHLRQPSTFQWQNQNWLMTFLSRQSKYKQIFSWTDDAIIMEEWPPRCGKPRQLTMYCVPRIHNVTVFLNRKASLDEHLGFWMLKIGLLLLLVNAKLSLQDRAVTTPMKFDPQLSTLTKLLVYRPLKLR